MVFNTADPLTFFLLTIAAGIVLVGFYYFFREIGADALDLHEKRKEQRRDRDRREGKSK